MRLAAGPLVSMAFVTALCACGSVSPRPDGSRGRERWELENPPVPLPRAPLGTGFDLARSRVALTPEKVRLGRWLFYDARLSRDGTISCATCHRPAQAFSEPTPRSTGIGGQTGARKSPPIVNAGFPIFERYFWDGRAGSLVEQAKGPIANPVEMGNTLDGAARAVAAVPGYRRAFRETYGDERLDIDRIADALAAYETTRLSGNSAYDRFDAGDETALSPEALQGRDIFFGRGRCNACHLGPNFSDARFHNVGIGYSPRPGPPERSFTDPGRYGVTRRLADLGAFKTPTLREASRRAPYMHDGSLPDLAGSIARYVKPAENPWLDPVLREARLTPRDVPLLVAFLRALNGTGYEDVPPSSFPQ